MDSRVPAQREFLPAVPVFYQDARQEYENCSPEAYPDQVPPGVVLMGEAWGMKRIGRPIVDFS